MLGLPVATAAAAPRIKLQYFGLSDATHTSPETGERRSFAWTHGENGQPFLDSGSFLGGSLPYTPDSGHRHTSWIVQEGDLRPIGISEIPGSPNLRWPAAVAIAHGNGDTVAGYSLRTVDDDRTALLAWHYDGSRTRRIGLFDDASLPQSDYTADVPYIMNRQGHVTGLWENDVRPGRHSESRAWVFDGAATQRIGVASVPGIDTPYHANTLADMNEAGQVAGSTISGDYHDKLQTAWFFDGERTIPLALTEGRHTGPFGQRLTEAVALTETGLVALHSGQYIDIDSYPRSAPWGQTAWTYQDGVSREVGLTSAEYILRNGVTNSTIDLVAGKFVAGTSLRNDGSGAVWIDDGLQTVEIPTLDIPHPDPTLKTAPLLVALKEDGTAYGFAGKWPLGGVNVTAAWEYRDGVTRSLGLQGAEFIAATGESHSGVRSILANGYALGFTNRYVEDAYAGSVLWVYDGETSIPLELSKPGDDLQAIRRSDIGYTNAAGQVLGFTHVPSQLRRPTPWLYTPGEGVQSIDFPAGIEPLISGLSDDGWLYGHYYCGITPDDVLVDPQAFIWHSDVGLIDVVELREGVPWKIIGLSSADGAGRFLGTAESADGDYFVVLATIVPEPGAASLLIISLFMAFAISRRAARRTVRS